AVDAGGPPEGAGFGADDQMHLAAVGQFVPDAVHQKVGPGNLLQAQDLGVEGVGAAEVRHVHAPMVDALDFESGVRPGSHARLTPAIRWRTPSSSERCTKTPPARRPCSHTNGWSPPAGRWPAPPPPGAPRRPPRCASAPAART